MRRITTTLAVLAAGAMAVLVVAPPAQARPADPRHQPTAAAGTTLTEAYFEFDYPDDPATFVIRLTDPATIQDARDILAGTLTERTHVGGTIVKTPQPYNPPWSYHLDPSTIAFFGMAAEVCDAGIEYVENHLDEVGGSLLPGNGWCPWGSRLLREIT